MLQNKHVEQLTKTVATIRHKHLARRCYRQLDRYQRLDDDVFNGHHQCYNAA